MMTCLSLCSKTTLKPKSTEYQKSQFVLDFLLIYLSKLRPLDSGGCITMVTRSVCQSVYADKMSPPFLDASSRKSKFKLKEAVSSSADMLIATAWLQVQLSRFLTSLLLSQMKFSYFLRF